jgi:cell wall-associated NlpC family hydrolase
VTRHDKAMVIARVEVGVHEEPMRSNRGPRVQVYQHATWLPGTGWPWCVAFVQWVWKKAGLEFPDKTAGAYDLLARAKKRGLSVPVSKALPGDAIVFKIGSGHAALLARPYHLTEPYVETIDGNVSDMVAHRRRHITTVKGAVHVPEVVDKPMTPAKPPLFEVVTSESGHAKVVYVSGAKAISKKLDQLLRKHGRFTIRPHKRNANR